MSTIVMQWSGEHIILGADSRTTFSVNGKQKAYADIAEKLFVLPRSHVAVAIAGPAAFKGRLVSTVVRRCTDLMDSEECLSAVLTLERLLSYLRSSEGAGGYTELSLFVGGGGDQNGKVAWFHKGRIGIGKAASGCICNHECRVGIWKRLVEHSGPSETVYGHVMKHIRKSALSGGDVDILELRSGEHAWIKRKAPVVDATTVCELRNAILDGKIRLHRCQTQTSWSRLRLLFWQLVIGTMER